MIGLCWVRGVCCRCVCVRMEMFVGMSVCVCFVCVCRVLFVCEFCL